MAEPRWEKATVNQQLRRRHIRWNINMPVRRKGEEKKEDFSILHEVLFTRWIKCGWMMREVRRDKTGEDKAEIKNEGD